MMVALVVVGILLLSFAGVLLVGAPYLPTLSRQAKVAIDLLDLSPGQTVLELGCGDGRVLVVAARRGLKVVGIELNPFLALISWLRTLRYRGQVRVIWGDFWLVPWPQVDGIFVFLIGKYMAKLDAKVRAQEVSVRLVSFAFPIPGRVPNRQKDGVMLYHYGKDAIALSGQSGLT